MSKIHTESLVDIIFSLQWKSETANHTDCYQASKVNIWRDYFPNGLLDGLIGKEPGERVEIELASGAALPDYDEKKRLTIKRNQFAASSTSQAALQPHLGRFYPQGLLRDVGGIFRANIQPFRCVGINNGSMTIDLNHPMAGRKARLSCLIGKVEEKKSEKGGSSVDWIATLAEGPGMQARWQNQRTDYLSAADANDRQDSRPDTAFYREPRLVQHIDDTAIEMVRNTYGRFLSDGMAVLDLMSSWQSHVPTGLNLGRLVGLGLNAAELKKNRQLTDYTVRDLNQVHTLPYADNTFDVVLNTVSVEYLTDPVTIFKEVARVLRPGGHYVVTFSNRWFPTKAIRIWERLHEFERMGLVTEYFLRAGGFTDLHTYSIRGLPRPHTDKYFPERRLSDPIYAVWGQKI